jgi:hypothetical protein
MLRYNSTFKKTPVQLLAGLLLLAQSCYDNSTQQAQENNITDTINYADKGKGSIREPAALNGLENVKEDPATAERRQLIAMQIDSTYEAIALLDDAKKELTETSAAELTVVERNKKSKLIFNINIIQNELTRALDASILANLKIRTNNLAGITAILEKDVAHLKSVTQKLNKATQYIGRLTNILALGLSKGCIKPAIPRKEAISID